MRCQRFFMPLIATLVALSVSSAFVAAQSAIKPMKDLSVGNRWVYGITSSESGTNMGKPFASSSSSFFYEEVRRDSIIHGKRYSQIFSSFNNSVHWERAETNTLFLWHDNQELVSFSFDSTLLGIKTYMFSLGGRWCGDANTPCPIYDFGIFRTFDSDNNTISLLRVNVSGTYASKQSLQYSRYIGAVLVNKQTDVTQYFTPRAGVGPVLALSSTAVDNVRLIAAKLQDSIIGDNNLLRSLVVSVPSQTYLRPNTVAKIPLRLSGAPLLGDVFNTPPTIELTYNRNAVEAVNLPSSAVIDSSGAPIGTILRIIPRLDTTLPELQFRISPNTREVGSELRLSMQNSTPIQQGQVSVSSGTITFTRPSYDVLSYLFPPKQAIQGSTINIVGSLIGTRAAAEYGIKQIQTTLKIPTSLAQPEGTFPISNGFHLIPMNFVLSTDANSETTEVRLRITSKADTTVSLELINSLAIPNAANFNLIRLLESNLVIRLLPQSTSSTATTSSLSADGQSAPIVIEQISPNPAKDEISISYTLRTDTPLEIMLFDIQGNKVRTLAPLTEQKAGTFTLTARTDNVVSGQYRVVLQAPRGNVQAQINVIR